MRTSGKGRLGREVTIGDGIRREGWNRLDIFKRTCPLGDYHMADSDGVLIDVAE